MLILAHPLTQPGELLLPPIVVVTLVVSVVAFVAQGRLRSASAGAGSVAVGGLRLDGQLVDRRLDLLDIGGRLLGVGLLVLAVLAGRLGVASELENVAPALVIGFGWPALILGSAVLPTLWPRLNPWDGLARVLGARDGEPVADVRWAVPAAFGWVAYLGVLLRPLTPQTVGAALAVYTIVTVAACLAMGRVRWLTSGEVFTVFFGWVGLRGGLVAWTPPRGAAAVLGVLGGGLLFGALRFSDLWAPLALSTVWTWVGLIGICGIAVAVLALCERRASRAGAAGAVAAAAVPAVAALALAVALARNRLFVSAQLLPSVLSDPFGRGLDPLGIGEPALNPAPLGIVGLLLVQLAVLLTGHLLGAVIGRRRATQRARGAVTLALAVLSAGGTLAVTTV